MEEDPTGPEAGEGSTTRRYRSSLTPGKSGQQRTSKSMFDLSALNPRTDDGRQSNRVDRDHVQYFIWQFEKRYSHEILPSLLNGTVAFTEVLVGGRRSRQQWRWQKLLDKLKSRQMFIKERQELENEDSKTGDSSRQEAKIELANRQQQNRHPSNITRRGQSPSRRRSREGSFR
ncbi:hypothetical protein NPIL_629311 [Nephila pilipes]|uniref:Uncharacterized protein n=1 Tax=Nephila pilipes TaxID=299642 RepID=A0A8X6P1M8_NEPPI|nr:hypothetical protein NPIL_629311 [Nephila pilipes]